MSKIFKIKNIKKTKLLDKTVFEYAEHCPMDFVLENSIHFEDLSTLVIGTMECSFYSKLVRESDEKALHYAYLLEDKDIIFGCEEKIKSSLTQMFSEGAKNIILLPTCIPNVTGLDVSSYVEHTKIKNDENLFFLSIPHFKNLSTSDDMANFYDVILNKPKNRYEVTNSENIAFYTHNPKLTHIKNVVQFERIRDIKSLPNILSCKFHLVFSKLYLKAVENFCEQNDKNFIDMCSLKADDKSKENLLKLLKIEEFKIFDIQKDEKSENQTKEKLKNRSISILSNGADEIALYLESLGLCVKQICLKDVDEYKKKNLKKVKNKDLQIFLDQKEFLDQSHEILLPIDFSKVQNEISPTAKLNKLNQIIGEILNASC